MVVIIIIIMFNVNKHSNDGASGRNYRIIFAKKRAIEDLACISLTLFLPLIIIIIIINNLL